MNKQLQPLLDQLSSVLLGKRTQLEDCVCCFLANGHLLIEDVPGVGKTTLAQALAKSLGLHYSRVQFTADLMPSDLLGVSVFDRNQGAFSFHTGPVFSQVLLADEINRASPKTQSALLEAMEERQVSVEGETRKLPSPFFVLATQNPNEQVGTYPLPESQLDRFLMRLSLGYPDPKDERELMQGQDRREVLAQMSATLTPGELQAMQQEVLKVHAADALLDYVQALVAATRTGQLFIQGLSPRATLALLRVAKAQAFLHGRNYAVPEDVQAVFAQTVTHRLVAAPSAHASAAVLVRQLLESTPI
jgi:MoxR-like ATPase